MRIETLNVLTAGISRLRTLGGADKSTLYDLLNGWVDLAGRVQSRPGTEDGVDLPAGTKGLVAFDGAMVVFSSSFVEDMPDGYTCEVLVHPTDATQELIYIHFAAPFLGYLYVVAEFADGEVFHYWLQGAEAWTANTTYTFGQLVEPTVRNGLVYKATRLGDPGIVWAPNVVRTVGDVVEPTVPNSYEYECIDTLGSNPRSGTTEPAWPTEDGATIAEDTDLAQPVTTSTGATTATALPSGVVARYGSGLDEGFAGLNSEDA